MGWLQVQGTNNVANNIGASTTQAMPGASVVGNRLIVVTSCGLTAASGAGASVLSITDSASPSNTYVKHVTDAANSDGTEVAIWSAPIRVAGTLTLTFNFESSTNHSWAVAMEEYSGLSTFGGAGALDGSQHGAGTTSAVSSGATAATSGPNELVIGGYGDYGNSNSGTVTSGGSTFRQNDFPSSVQQVCLQDKDSGASGGTQTSTLTLGNITFVWSMCCAVFKLAMKPPTRPNMQAVHRAAIW